MKITDLNKNDVVRIKTKKEAKELMKLLNHPMPSFFVSYPVIIWIANIEKSPCVYWNIKHDGEAIPASKFLKQSISKKDLQEALSKVGEELSSMNERLGKLEAKSEPKTTNGIEIHFDEVTEGLPNKWVVAITDGNKPKLEKWYQESHCKENLMSGYYVSNSYFIWTGVPSDYTEITFDTFKKYVLKEEVKETQPEAIDFSKAGQLVKSGDIIVYTDGSESPETFGGTRLESEIGRKGHYSKNWVKSFFTLCTEPVTLQN